MALPSTIPKGTILSGKYRVGRELGRGGMAAVYRALNVDIGKNVAIKLLAGHLAASQTVVERFLREARAVSQISSPHICDIYDSGRLEDGTPFLVMELLEGESLYDAMCRDRQMSPKLTLAIILQVGRGLAKAHATNIVHRDLKPENIFLTVDVDGRLLVKVLDFGLAKFYDPVHAEKGKARLTREGAVFGTPAYMSPEQVRGQAAADTRADLWALACITYECFTGTTVWSTEEGVAMTFAQIATAPIPEPREYRPDLPQSFSDWFQKALHRDIKKRFQTVRELADGLVAAFDYQARRGGLDIKLVNQITHEASGGDSSTMRHARTHSSAPPSGLPSRPDSESGSRAPVSRTPTPQGVYDPRHEQLTEVEQLSGKRSGTKVAIAALLALVIGGGVVAAASTKTVAPPDPVRLIGPTVAGLARAQTAPATSASSGFSHVAKHPWLPRVREAQVMIARSDYDGANKMLTRLNEEHQHPMLKNLLEQTKVARVAKKGSARCTIAGLARPRRTGLISQEGKARNASSPSIVRGHSGAVMLWTDTRENQRRAFAVPLDDEMRNRGLPVDITPEGASVSSPRLIPAAQRYLASYLDMGAQQPGVFARWIRDDAVIDGSLVRVGDKRGIASEVDATRLPDGRFAVAFSDREDADSIDLFYRLFDSNGKPEGPPVRVTDYGRVGPQPGLVRDVRLSTLGSKLVFAYSFQRGAQQSIRYVAIPMDTQPPGLEKLPTSKRTKPRMLSDAVVLSPNNVQATDPSLACTEQGCFISWHQTGRPGAGVAFVDAKSGKRQWYKRFAALGRHPALASSPGGDVALVWIEGQRLTVGTLDRAGVGPHSKVALARWEHSAPVITAGPKRGEWYVAWLDFETGRREPYGARIKCQ